MTRYTLSSLLLIMIVGLGSCVTDPNSPGLEYMPDMYRSPAVEAYVDYGEDPYYKTEEVAKSQRNTISARKPVEGTIAQVKSGDFNMPYAYPNTDEGYAAAGANLTSPLATNQENIEAGMEIYQIMCTHCHGEKGEGDGAISRNGLIKGIPSYTGKLKDLPVGNIYHTLQYGKGLMGSHASQMTQKERWQVIEYVKVLQNGGEMPEFDANGNVLTAAASSDEAAQDQPQ
ncbi:MAG: cytochrome c [Flavobacteriales bacterium]|nr:cytochrome c [Flavobacteriales bacterium]MDP4587015.1 cytochrome c [Flavobacteriales bacterium]MDP4953814.1 cytochrome c [Flavobacteriales bacterium]